MKSYLIIALSALTLQVCGQQQPGKVSKPKNIIFLIGDGMGTTQIYAGLTANKGHLNLERFKCIGFSKTNSASDYITESSAGATAFAIGEKTYNGAIAVDVNKQRKPSILEIVKAKGWSTGIVVTTDITDATPAVFAAHQPSREMADEIAADYLNADLDVLIGAGTEHFNQRKDGRNLIAEFEQNGYQFQSTTSGIVKAPVGRLLGLVKEARIAERGDQLLQTQKKALSLLSRNKGGFFLMVEGSKIDDGGHANDLKYVTEELIDFDQAIGAALDFAAKDGQTLVVVTADHECGGLTITDGNLKTGEVSGKFSTDDHTGVMVPVFAYGPGAESFMGIYDNHTIFAKFMALITPGKSH
jgi:alkaline phosphatase